MTLLKTKEERLFHDLRGSLMIVRGFFKVVNKADLPSDKHEMFDAAQISLEKMFNALDELDGV